MDTSTNESTVEEPKSIVRDTIDDKPLSDLIMEKQEDIVKKARVAYNYPSKK